MFKKNMLIPEIYHRWDGIEFGRLPMRGGGGKAPKDNSMQLQQNQIAAAERERQERQAQIDREMAALGQNPNAPVTTQEAAAYQARLEQERKDREARERFNTQRDTAVSGARSTVSSELNKRGLDANKYGGSLNAEIDRIMAGIPDLDPNPTSYFDPSFVDRVLTSEETAARDRYGRDVKSNFKSGFEKEAVVDTADDAFLDAIYNQQYGDARSTIERARARGDLNDVGMNAAFGELSNAGTSAKTTLTGIGDTVLGRYRDDLSNIANRASNEASGWQLGESDFSIDPYLSDFSNTRTKQQGSLEGDVRGAASGTQLFDIGKLLDRGAKIQGPSSGDPNDFVASVLGSRRKNTTDRGVGSTGVF